MTKEVCEQDDLPNFNQALAEAKQEGLDAVQHLSRQYIRFAKMAQKCRDPKQQALIRTQQQCMIKRLGTAR